MAQPQQNITIPAPGNLGLNLEDAPIDMDQRFCLKADNAVIDRLGRLSARKGFDPFLSGGSPDSSAVVRRVNLIVDNGVKRLIAAVETGGGYALWEISNYDSVPVATTLTLPVGYTMSTAEVQIISFAGYGIIVGGGELLTIRDGVVDLISNGDGFILPQDDTGTVMSTLDFDTGTAAYGRLWLSGGSAGDESIHYCSINNPFQWYDGRAVPASNFNTGGIIDVYESWPLGRDRIMDIAGHNNMLVVFGRNSLLVYGNPQGDPAATGGIYLADTVVNIGLVDKQALVSDGRDILFMDDSGLRSLGRTIQEQSAAIGDLTRPVRSELQQAMQVSLLGAGNSIELSYNPTESLILVILKGANDVFVCNTRQPLPDGSFPVTRWTGAPLTTGKYIEEISLHLLGCSTGTPLAAYRGQSDFTNQSYTFNYSSPVLSFGDPARIKFVKQIDYMVVSGQQESRASGKWSYVGTRPYQKEKYVDLAGGEASLYGTSDYLFNTATFGEGEQILRSYKVNADGSGENVIVEFSAEVSNSLCSIQQLNIQALLGRIT